MKSLLNIPFAYVEALDNLLIQSNKRETDICEHDFPSKQAFEFTEVGFSFFFMVLKNCNSYNELPKL